MPPRVLGDQPDIKRRAGSGASPSSAIGRWRTATAWPGRSAWRRQALASRRGAATGAGGAWTTLIDVPLLFTLGCGRSARSAIATDSRWRTVAAGPSCWPSWSSRSSGSLETRRRRLDRLRDIGTCSSRRPRRRSSSRRPIRPLPARGLRRSTGDGRDLGGRAERGDDEPGRRGVAADLPGAAGSARAARWPRSRRPRPTPGRSRAAGPGPSAASASAGCYYLGFGVAPTAHAGGGRRSGR